ncbi:uncharacterized protein LOC100824590 [Brachypodium distachyon]|uniref:Uncharacterized protein n=1 Tax=Brachypodium distachyon TaxID=15368 RepID=I1HP25_BRADI|nr:uncharacterized protein LOC100824590 [Brachypodium distachyon]KQK08556.1 hypothetical protein BRADI_2g42490v3 [Brachypodium distachyon]|eukprot:XP_003566834.1 uncharacterized protein LOC100824590 [Brachypodium distachyon]
MVAAGRAGANLSAAAAFVAAVAPLLVLAGVARADCFAYCFKNCIANDKSMTDYCNYACDKTCEGDARPLALGADMGCQLSCAKTSCSRLGPDCKAVEACFGQCYDGCRTTKTLPRPLRAGAGPIFPSSEPDPDDDAPEKKHRHPFHEKQDAVQPASEPDPDDGHRPASGLNRYFHEKQDAVQPASEPDPDDTLPPSGSGIGARTPLSEIHAAPPAPV